MGDREEKKRKWNENLRVQKDAHRRFQETLEEMIAAAPVDALKYRSPDLAEKILLASFHVQHMKWLSGGNLSESKEDDAERSQLRKKLPNAQILGNQLTQSITHAIDAIQPFIPNGIDGVKMKELFSNFHYHSQRVGMIISDMSEIVGIEEGVSVCGLKRNRREDPIGEQVPDLSKTKKEEVLDNSYEEKFRSNIVPPGEIDVTLDDIGALTETKKLIHELVILPIKRPKLFKGGLLKPCKGVLFFGPPGTGKTVLAKAIAKESGANFINVSLASIFDMWVGESEKNVNALFTLAAKVAPTVIFVDEVDSLFGRRTSNECDSGYRKVKNEFMSFWDGLTTKTEKQILVLGATNRPFDLDEAIVRRFERRILIDLPCEKSRQLILKKILAKESVGRMDFKKLATLTEGYSGSDLKNLCIAAAYQPLRDLLNQEELAPKDDNQNKEDCPLRELSMGDIMEAKKLVAPSYSANASIMLELKKWNDLYGVMPDAHEMKPLPLSPSPRNKVPKASTHKPQRNLRSCKRKK